MKIEEHEKVLNLLPGSGDQLDHRIFKSKALSEKRVPLEFPERSKILLLMRDIELDRNVICYGTRKPNNRIERFIGKFHELRKIINKILKDKKNAAKK